MKPNFIFIEKMTINGKEYAKISMEDLEKLADTSWNEGFSEGYAKGKEYEEELRKNTWQPDDYKPYLDPSKISPYKPYEVYYETNPWWKDGPYCNEDIQSTGHGVKSYTYTTSNNKSDLNCSSKHCNSYECTGECLTEDKCKCSGECMNDV